MTPWDPGTIYMRHVGADGHGYVQEHRCWNRVVFIEARQRETDALNAACKGQGKARVDVLSEAEFQKEKAV